MSVPATWMISIPWNGLSRASPETLAAAALGGHGLEAHRIAELLEAPNMMTLNPTCIAAIEVVDAQVGVGLAGAENVVDRGQNAVSDRDRSLIPAAAPGRFRWNWA